MMLRMELECTHAAVRGNLFPGEIWIMRLKRLDLMLWSKKQWCHGFIRFPWGLSARMMEKAFSLKYTAYGSRNGHRCIIMIIICGGFSILDYLQQQSRNVQDHLLRLWWELGRFEKKIIQWCAPDVLETLWDAKLALKIREIYIATPLTDMKK